MGNNLCVNNCLIYCRIYLHTSICRNLNVISLACIIDSPSAVTVEISDNKALLSPVTYPVQCSGLKVIKLKLPKPEIARVSSVYFNTTYDYYVVDKCIVIYTYDRYSRHKIALPLFLKYSVSGCNYCDHVTLTI